MPCVQKMLLLAFVVFCVGCSNRQLENRVTETEQNTSTVRSDVLALEQRVESLEGRMRALSTEVGSLEVKTLRGKKTNYIVTPAVKTGSAAAPSTSPALPTTAAERMVPAGQSIPPTTTPTTTPAKTRVPAPAEVPAVTTPAPSLPTTAALSLPPATAPVPASQVKAEAAKMSGATSGMAGTMGTSGVMGTVDTAGASGPSGAAVALVPAPSTPPTTPIPAQGAVSLALPPENGGAGQKMADGAAAGGRVLLPATSGASASAPSFVAPVAAPAVAPAPAATPVRLAPLPPKMKGEEAAYNAALALARGGRPAEAIQSFKAFLQEYPSGRYAPNAYYWIGESMYAQRQYADALLQFKEVSARYPRHHKTADALLKAGMTYTRMGDKENAALQYRAVLTDFPASEAARYVKGRGLAR